MALQFKLDTLDGLDESTSKMYQEKDGVFYLNIEGLPKDNSSEYEDRIQKMDSKITELLDEKKAAKKKADDAIEQARKDAEEAARKSGDVDALDKSWQEKYSKREAELINDFEPKINQLQNLLHKKTVMASAIEIASDLALPGSAKALLPHIQSRLEMEVKDDEAITVVRGLDGKPSALTLDELKTEIKNEPAFAPLIAGSKSSGGGADGDNGGGAAPSKVNLTGTKAERQAALSERFPHLNQ